MQSYLISILVSHAQPSDHLAEKATIGIMNTNGFAKKHQ